MAISFNEIPSNQRTPLAIVEFDDTLARYGLPGRPAKCLIIGQKYPAGAANVGTPYLIGSTRDAEGLGGAGSMLYRMAKRYVDNSSSIEVWGIALDDATAGVAAVGSLTFGGTATAAGTHSAWIGGRRYRVADLGGGSGGSTNASLATALATEIQADPYRLIDAAVDGTDTTTVNLTARHKGEAGNDIDVRVNYYSGELTPSGRTVTIVAMAGGTGNPDMGPALVAMADTEYTDIVCPWTDGANLAQLETELTTRADAMHAKGAVSYLARAGSYATLATWGNTRNGKRMSAMGVYRSPSPPEEWAAAVAGRVSQRAQADPARPYTGLSLVGILPPAAEDRFDRRTRNNLLYDGISTFLVDQDGTVRIEQTITTYQKTALGVDDPTWLKINTPKTLDYLRWDIISFFDTGYTGFKLSSDPVRADAGQAIMSPKTAEGLIRSRGDLWIRAGLVEGIDPVLVERDIGDPNRLNAVITPDLVNQFDVFAAKFQFVI